eukprot:766683-Hanusia_phi.AAC.6
MARHKFLPPARRPGPEPEPGTVYKIKVCDRAAHVVPNAGLRRMPGQWVEMLRRRVPTRGAGPVARPGPVRGPRPVESLGPASEVARGLAAAQAVPGVGVAGPGDDGLFTEAELRRNLEPTAALSAGGPGLTASGHWPGGRALYHRTRDIFQ